jgi:hypothetical protein
MGTERSIRAASVDFYVFGDAVEPPAGIADLSRRIGDIPGTDPAGLIARLCPIRRRPSGRSKT